MVVALLALVGVCIATYLTLFKLGIIGQLVCSIGSCETVNTSRWATFLGVPVAAWGVATYLVLFVVALAGLQPGLIDSRAIAWVLVLLSGWSVLFSAWLTYLELFVIHAVCVWCATSAAVMTLIFFTSLVALRQRRDMA